MTARNANGQAPMVNSTSIFPLDAPIAVSVDPGSYYAVMPAPEFQAQLDRIEEKLDRVLKVLVWKPESEG